MLHHEVVLIMRYRLVVRHVACPIYYHSLAIVLGSIMRSSVVELHDSRLLSVQGSFNPSIWIIVREV